MKYLLFLCFALLFNPTNNYNNTPQKDKQLIGTFEVYLVEGGKKYSVVFVSDNQRDECFAALGVILTHEYCAEEYNMKKKKETKRTK